MRADGSPETGVSVAMVTSLRQPSMPVETAEAAAFFFTDSANFSDSVLHLPPPRTPFLQRRFAVKFGWRTARDRKNRRHVWAVNQTTARVVTLAGR